MYLCADEEQNATKNITEWNEKSFTKKRMKYSNENSRIALLILMLCIMMMRALQFSIVYVVVVVVIILRLYFIDAICIHFILRPQIHERKTIHNNVNR